MAVRAPYINLQFMNSDVSVPSTDCLSLIVNKTYGDSYGEFRITVREQKGFKVSKEIGANRLKIKLSYGDSIANSKQYYGEVLKYQTEFKSNVMMLTIIGYITTKDLTDVEKKDRINWTSMTELHNNPSEIVQYICSKNGWILEECAPTIPLRHVEKSIIDYDYAVVDERRFLSARLPESAWSATVNLIQENMNDIQFIQSVLCPYSICIDSFLMNYALSISSKSGKTVVSFKPLKSESIKKNLFFSYNKSEGTFGQKEVLSFSSDIEDVYSASSPPSQQRTVKDAMLATLGTESIDTSGLTELGNIMFKARDQYRKLATSTEQEMEGKDEQSVLGDMQSYYDIYDKAATAYLTIFYNDRIINSIDNNKSYILSDEIQQYQSQIDSFGELAQTKPNATLTVLGNESLIPGDSLDMLIMMEQGVHYTSGTYLITKLTDSIELGKFTTQYTLLKNTKAFISSTQELQSLGLSLADVYLSQYAKSILASPSNYVESTNTVKPNDNPSTEGSTTNTSVSDWPGTDQITPMISDIISVQGKSGSREKQLKTMVARYNKPYIGQYTSFNYIFKSENPPTVSNKVTSVSSVSLIPKQITPDTVVNGQSTASKTIFPFVFRCTKEFREKYITDSSYLYYITIPKWDEQAMILSSKTRKVWNWKQMKFINEMYDVKYKADWVFLEDRPVIYKGYIKWYYAGDQTRTATQAELVYGDADNGLEGYVQPGTIIRDGEILKQKDGSGYITAAQVEIYWPDNLELTEYGIFDKNSLRIPKSMPIRLYKVKK